MKTRAKNLYDALKAVTTTYGDGGATYAQFEQLLRTNGANENSVTLFYYKEEDTFLLKHLTSGENSHSVKVFGGTPSAVATIHNHPNGTPPSGVDLLVAAENANENPDFSSCYVHTTNGTYTLIIEDREKAIAFYKAHKGSNAAPGDNVLFNAGTQLAKIWDKSYGAFSHFGDNDRHLLALADLLRTSNAGISVVRNENTSPGFEVISTHIRDGELVPVKCK